MGLTGSPPHAWRRWSAPYGSKDSITVHLHTRGDALNYRFLRLFNIGSPPHAWRRCLEHADAYVSDRFTSTRVETLIGAAGLEKLLDYPELRYMPAQQVGGWEKDHRGRVDDPRFDRKRAEQIAVNRKRILKALHDGGVRLLLGSDAPQQFSVPGFSLHREMELMRECGLTPYEIIRSGTKNVGDYFKDKDEFGTIAVGKRADLILIDGDPLKDVSNIAKRAGVMVRGRWLPEGEIQERLAKIAASYRKDTSR